MSKANRQPLVEAALGWVQMQPHARRRVDTLSGGERQRVALARALVDHPQCVHLHEPLSALDPHLRTSTLELLQDIQSRLGLTYLYITHDRDEALRIGHRIGVLNQGRLEQLATPEEVYRRPATPFVASFLGRINWLTSEIANSVGNALRGVPRPGEQLRIGIRPEDLRITPDGPLQARVASRQFSGDSTHLRLELEDGSTLLVDERPASDAPLGSVVRVGWRPESLHVFPAEKEVLQ
jgi:ABC-type Fe3+/spermidine/putrescine transport system ATPase subunit